jgi:capsular polysaccharide transport system permease protein
MAAGQRQGGENVQAGGGGPIGLPAHGEGDIGFFEFWRKIAPAFADAWRNPMMLAVRGHLNVLRALIIRDLMGRFGRNHLGFVWTILEPMILCVGVMLVWSMIRESMVHGIPVVAFVITLYMPLTLWRHLTGPLVKLVRNNAELLYHRPITHIHILLARCVLEFFSSTVALIVIYFVVVTVGLVEPVQDPSLALAGWLFAGWYFGAFGMLVSVSTEYWEPAEKFVQPMMYLQLPLCGAFVMVDWLPRYGQKLLLLNPSVHCFEMFRAGFFGEEVTTHYDAGYLAAWSAGLTVLAVAAVYHLGDRIQTN